MLKKLIRPALALVLCLILTGCVYNTADTTVHDDCSGKVTYVDALILDEGEEIPEGAQIFEENGNKYYGTSTEYTFASAKEFNALFAVASGEEDEAPEGAIAGNSAPFTLAKNADGSLTLTAALSTLKAEETPEAAQPETGTDGSESTEADESSLTPEEQAELLKSITDTAIIRYTFTFDKPVRQIAGPADSVKIEGSKLTIDLLQASGSDEDLVFTTAAAPQEPAPAAQPKVVLSPQKLAVNGATKATEIYNIDGTNYFKIRDLAALLNGTGAQFNVGFDAQANAVVVTTGKAYEANGSELKTGVDNSATAVPSPQSILIDGKKADLTAWNIGGANFFGLRALQPYLGYEVGFDAATNTAQITAK